MKKIRVLVVDDDPSICEVFRMRMEREKWEVTTALEAGAALELLKEQHWDILITDVVMPGINGFILVETVRSLYPALPTIIITGQSTFHTVDILLSGCSGFVSKPIDWPYFMKMTRKLIDRDLTESIPQPAPEPDTEELTEAQRMTIQKAEEGETSAQCRLGEMYRYGTGVPQDNVRAYMWLNLSAVEYEKAARGRDELAKRMTPEEVALGQQLSRHFVPKPKHPPENR